jgi:hypothetical protein
MDSAHCPSKLSCTEEVFSGSNGCSSFGTSLFPNRSCPTEYSSTEASLPDSTKLGDQTISQTQNPLTQNSTSLRQLGVDDRGTDTLVEQRSFGQKDSSKDERIHGQNSSSIEQSPSTEGRDASVLEYSVGQDLLGKSDVPKLEHPFEPENTSSVHDNLLGQCAESNNLNDVHRVLLHRSLSY